MASPVLTIDSVTKRYKGKAVIDNISANMFGGEIIGLVGMTGAGKTTLIKLIGGLVMPDSGDIQMHGVSMYRDFEKCMMTTGVVPDRPAFYNYLSGRKNLSVFASMYKGIGRSVIDELSSELGLDDYIDSPVESYPAGVRAKLAIAAALVNSPTLLVMDEILSFLDPVDIINIRRFLRKLASDHGVCILISSGHMTEVERVCDKVAVIEHGQLLGISPIDLIKKANLNKSRHKMLLDRPEEAALFLNETDGAGVEIHDDYIIVDAEQSKIPRYISMLGARGFLVYEVAPLETTLENAYVRMLIKNPSKQGGSGHA